MNYAQIAQVAHQMLSKFGTTATLTRKTAGAYDPATSAAVVTSSSQTITAIATPYPAKMIDGTMIRVGDLQVFVSTTGVSFDPEPADTLTYNGENYTVVKATSHNPTGTPVLYELQVRR